MSKYSLFEIFGIEAEYMIVDRQTLQVKPIAEFVLSELNNGKVVNEVSLEKVAWSNELVSHVLEIKTNPPASSVDDIDERFFDSICDIQKILESKNAMLLPSAMHPWFQPESETYLWPYGQKDIYEKYDEIFSCKGHGWSNLQSVHINLPFKNEDEFGKLMPAIRFVLPFIPYMAASSPFLDGIKGRNADNRLDVYEANQKKVSSITGQVVPEAIYNFQQFNDLLESIYNDIAPYDPGKILQEPWLNSRGAIVKFDVGAIEIRVMDINESPLVDNALVSFFVNWIRYIIDNESILNKIKSFDQNTLVIHYQKAKGFEEPALEQSFFDVIPVNDSKKTFTNYLNEVHKLICDRMHDRHNKVIEYILEHGNLAKRLTKKSDIPSAQLYHKLAECLKENSVFDSNM